MIYLVHVHEGMIQVQTPFPSYLNDLFLLILVTQEERAPRLYRPASRLLLSPDGSSGRKPVSVQAITRRRQQHRLVRRLVLGGM